MSAKSFHQIFSAYPDGYSPRDGSSIEPFAGYSGAAILRVETGWGPCCLRGWPAGSLPPERICGLHRLLAHIHRGGLSEVAVPIATRLGETLVFWNEQHWQLEPWLPGAADYRSFPSLPRLRNIMARLARFHLLTRNYTDSGSARRWFFHQDQAPSPAVAERLHSLNQWQESKLSQIKQMLPVVTPLELRERGREFVARFDRLAPLIGTQLELLSRVGFRLQPCLRDLWHDHVLLTGEQVTGLIDASACRGENIATDLARLLGSLVLDDRDAWSFALAEYETHHPLTINEKTLVSALDQSGVLQSAMAWMDRLVLQREQTSLLPKILDRLDFLRGRLKHLDESVNRSLWLGNT